MAKKKMSVSYDDGKWIDNLGRNIIVDRLTNSMYVVPKSQNKRYNIMRGRLAFVAALTMAACAFISLPVGVCTFIGTFAIAEITYRCFFLKKLQKETECEMPGKPTLLEKYKMDNDGTLIMMLLLCLALIVILPIYIKQNITSINDALYFKDLNSSIILYGSGLLVILAVYLIYQTLATLIKRRQK